MSVLANDESYSNFVEVHTYEFTDLVSVSPEVIHGTHKLFKVDIVTDKPHLVDLPDRMRVQIDNDFYYAFKAVSDIN
jgi:hypothetical protein